MKRFAAVLICALPFIFGSAFAEEKAPTAQHTKMKACNNEAKTKELKGDERKKFMSICLKKDAEAKPVPAAAAAKK